MDLDFELGLSATAAARTGPPGSNPAPWSPLDLPNTVIWLDPSDLSTLWQETTGASATTPSQVNGVVGTIRDKVGGFYLTAKSDVARPILRKTGELYYLQTDGVDDTMQVIETPEYAQPNIAALGARFAETGRVFDGGTGANRHMIGLGTHYMQQYAGYWAGGKTGKTTSTAQAITTYWNDAASYIRYDGGAEELGTAGAHILKGLTFGSDFSGAHNAVADIYSIVIHNGDLSAEDRDKLEAYIAEKTGVTL